MAAAIACSFLSEQYFKFSCVFSLHISPSGREDASGPSAAVWGGVGIAALALLGLLGLVLLAAR